MSLVQSFFARPKFLIPLIVFLSVAGFFAVGLKLDSTRVPSPLVGKSAPSFNLPLLHLEQASFRPEDMKGQAWLLNVWASWCVACREEHEVLFELKDRGIPIVGLNYQDEPDDALRWLQDLGNPYLVTPVADKQGAAAIDWGVYGVPETFVIDRSGVIVYKHIGPITYNDVTSVILPLIEDSKS